MENSVVVTNLFDPNFDPLETLNQLTQAAINQQQMLSVLVDSHNAMNQRIVKQNSKIIELEKQIKALQQR